LSAPIHRADYTPQSLLGVAKYTLFVFFRTSPSLLVFLPAKLRPPLPAPRIPKRNTKPKFPKPPCRLVDDDSTGTLFYLFTHDQFHEAAPVESHRYTSSCLFARAALGSQSATRSPHRLWPFRIFLFSHSHSTPLTIQKFAPFLPVPTIPIAFAPPFQLKIQCRTALTAQRRALNPVLAFLLTWAYFPTFTHLSEARTP